MLAASVLVIGLQTAASGHAQTDTQRAGARAAATQGFHAYQKGQWQKAINLFTRAQELVHAPTQVLYIARAEAKLGHYVKAHELYLEITRQTLPANAPGAFRRAQKSAEKEVKEVQAKIAHLAIKVGGAGKTPVTVTMDGKPVPPELVGIQMPVDPGKHHIKAAASGFNPATKDVSLADGATQSISLTLQPNSSAAGPAAPPKASAPAQQVGTQTAPKGDQGTADHGGGSKGLRIGSYVALGVGVVGLGLGTFFVLRSSSKRKDANAAYNACGSPCLDSNPKSSEVASLDNQARSAKTLAAVGYVVGGVGVAAGVTLFVLSRHHHSAEHADAPSVHPWVGLRSAGVTGTF